MKLKRKRISCLSNHGKVPANPDENVANDRLLKFRIVLGEVRAEQCRALPGGKLAQRASRLFVVEGIATRSFDIMTKACMA